MSITAKLTSERSAFNASMTTSKGIIGASITEEIGAFNAFINTSTKIPDHLEIEGTWNGICVCGQPVSENIQNMVFKCVYRNGSYSLCTPTPSPEIWGETEGEQAITFSYEEGGVTITASKSAYVYKPKPVGGILFYIDSTADGDYLFWDENNNMVDAPTVGTDCTGWEYIAVGATKDKFYIYYDRLYTSVKWGGRGEVVGATGTAIGTGKTNTEAAIGSSADIPGSIWEIIRNMRSGEVAGCTDWYVNSKDELNEMRLASLVDWFPRNVIWTSTEINKDTAWNWNRTRWANWNWKTDALYTVYGSRSF